VHGVLWCIGVTLILLFIAHWIYGLNGLSISWRSQKVVGTRDIKLITERLDTDSHSFMSWEFPSLSINRSLRDLDC
jgi:hypothetical protein